MLELVKNNGRSPSAPLRAGSAPSPHKLRIVDLGTGSGAIALALAKELPSAEIHASDISAKALEVARANAARHELTSRIEFHQADLLDGFSLAAFDIVVSNPPYVGESEEDSVQIEVRKFEPRNAVFAGPTGLEVIERLLDEEAPALVGHGRGRTIGTGMRCRRRMRWPALAPVATRCGHSSTRASRAPPMRWHSTERSGMPMVLRMR